MQSCGLKGPQKPKPYCANSSFAVLSFTSILAVRSGPVWRQDLAVLSPEGPCDSTGQLRVPSPPLPGKLLLVFVEEKHLTWVGCREGCGGSCLTGREESPSKNGARKEGQIQHPSSCKSYQNISFRKPFGFLTNRSPLVEGLVLVDLEYPGWGWFCPPLSTAFLGHELSC